MKWIDIKLEEYKIIRTEINNYVKIQYTLISLGFTAIGALAGFGISILDDILSLVIFFVGIPILSNILLFLWTGLVRRSLRNASYCYMIEKEISKVISKPQKIKQNALNWEIWVNKMNKSQKKKKKNNQEKLDYFVIFALFLLFVLISLILACCILFNNPDFQAILTIKAVIIFSILFFLIRTTVFFFRGLEIAKNYG
jgi:hypothetical protein